MEKETNTGIYQIYFTGDDTKRYIGSSKDIKTRWSKHKSGLKNGNHRNKPLQEAYNKYGIDNLKLFVIKYLPDYTQQDVRYAVEQYWIDTVGFDNLYNVCPNAGSTEGAIVTEDARKNGSEAKRNKEVWDNYHLIKDLHILNPELGYFSLVKLFNNTFCTKYPSYSFQSILIKIKEEIVQRNS